MLSAGRTESRNTTRTRPRRFNHHLGTGLVALSVFTLALAPCHSPAFLPPCFFSSLGHLLTSRIVNSASVARPSSLLSHALSAALLDLFQTACHQVVVCRCRCRSRCRRRCHRPASSLSRDLVIIPPRRRYIIPCSLGALLSCLSWLLRVSFACLTSCPSRHIQASMPVESLGTK